MVHPLEIDGDILTIVVSNEVSGHEPILECSLEEFLGLTGSGFGVERGQFFQEVVALQEEDESLGFVSRELLTIKRNTSPL